MAVKHDITLVDRGNQTIGIIGKASLNLTAADSTTAAVYVGGRCLGRIRNRTANPITVSFYELEDDGGEPFAGSALAAYDEDGQAIASKTIPAWGSMQWPNGLAGVEWAVIRLSTGTGVVGIVIHR